MNLLFFVYEHKETLATFILSVITVLKLTQWGQAKSAALDTVVSTIENLNLSEAKRLVKAKSVHLQGHTRDALDHAVAKADTKQKPKPLGKRLAHSVARGLLTKVLK